MAQVVFSRVFYWRWWLFGLLIILLSLWGYIKLKNPDVLPIRTVKIVGDYNFVARQLLIKKIMPFVHGGFFSINISEIQGAALAFPGVKEVYVKRVWPQTIIINIQPEKILGRWADHYLLTDSGNLVMIKDQKIRDQYLPLFTAPLGDELKIVNFYQQSLPLLKQLPWQVKNVMLSDGLQWSIRFNNNTIVKLGQRDVQLRLQRLVEVFPQLFANSEKRVNYIDMRYTKGMTVKWQTQQA
ncbi:Cell division protein FtsQ [Piscirickettsia salmonis]|uniref:cell division protein FtsQ/DivIB n=1 Tax=Piscirickettsia salmonis TaxID=1238 RepID=UPI0012B852E4|nr:cell division protein FtsQ/DivIB [Piscirickettsia salmonis]QGP48623.1 Cell division protein FtsQ [Piscirickettsia salmonis]QGP52638.1 Cell division protein FtsQ [Piscirickettsia salmonis]QGP57493.1 Cell division protein FtsQ [Piscirickettsia salmonis]QGP62206.1 Cell division protein FtsQ [Piscirickettsia salmonis]